MADKSEHRELLRLAADAAGIPTEWSPECECPLRLDRVGTVPWNPRDDDGDALRLACALKINIEHAETLQRKAHGVNCWPVGRGDCAHMECDLTDYSAATRRAIVRAAAAMAAPPAVGVA